VSSGTKGFTGRASRSYVQLSFIRRVRRMRTRKANPKFRDACLNKHAFIMMTPAHRAIEARWIKYNTE
jgi:hypothetical protein